jgi:RNA polymerase sigma-70 factor (ECF subfamily)
MRDKGWLKPIFRSDRKAGERFVTEHYPDIFRLLRGLTGSEETAADLTQQTFVKAWQGIGTFEGRASLRTWLHRIAYHEYIHWLRDRREHAPLEAAAQLPALPEASDWELFHLPRALAQLTPELRDTFLLYNLQELSIAEIARILNVPAGTVKSRLFIARQRLRTLLLEEGPPTRSQTVAPRRPTGSSETHSRQTLAQEEALDVVSLSASRRETP